MPASGSGARRGERRATDDHTAVQVARRCHPEARPQLRSPLSTRLAPDVQATRSASPPRPRPVSPRSTRPSPPTPSAPPTAHSVPDRTRQLVWQQELAQHIQRIRQHLHEPGGDDTPNATTDELLVALTRRAPRQPHPHVAMHLDEIVANTCEPRGHLVPEDRVAEELLAEALLRRVGGVEHAESQQCMGDIGGPLRHRETWWRVWSPLEPVACRTPSSTSRSSASRRTVEADEEARHGLDALVDDTSFEPGEQETLADRTTEVLRVHEPHLAQRRPPCTASGSRCRTRWSGSTSASAPSETSGSGGGVFGEGDALLPQRGPGGAVSGEQTPRHQPHCGGRCMARRQAGRGGRGASRGAARATRLRCGRRGARPAGWGCSSGAPAWTRSRVGSPSQRQPGTLSGTSAGRTV